MRHPLALVAGLMLSVAAADAQTVCGYVAATPKPPAPKGLFPVAIAQVDGKKVEGRDAARVKLPAGPHQIGVLPQIAEDRRGRARLEELGLDDAPATLKTIEINVQADGGYLLAAQLVADRKDRQPSAEYWEPVVWRKTVDSCR